MGGEVVVVAGDQLPADDDGEVEGADGTELVPERPRERRGTIWEPRLRVEAVRAGAEEVGAVVGAAHGGGSRRDFTTEDAEGHGGGGG